MVALPALVTVGWKEMLVEGALVTGGNENSPVGFAGSSLDTVVEVGTANEKPGASFAVSVLLPNANAGFGASFGAPKANGGAVVLKGAEVAAGASSLLAGVAPKLNKELGLMADVESSDGIDFLAGDASLAGGSARFIAPVPNLNPEGAGLALLSSSGLSLLNKTFTLPS